MVAGTLRARGRWPIAGLAIGAPLLAGLLGALYLAPVAGLALLALPALAVAAIVAWRWPELLFVSVAWFHSELFMRESLAIPLPVGRLDGADLSLVALLAIVALRALGRGELPMRWWPASGLALLYLGVAVLSAVDALLLEDVAPNLVVGELRPALFCFGCALGAAALTRPRQIARALVGLFLIADLTVAVVLLQNVLGSDNKLLAAMATGSWQVDAQHSTGAFGSVRIVPPGHVLVYAVSIVAFCLLLAPGRPRRERIALALQLGYLNFGLLLTFTRAQWIASAIALGLVVLFVPRPQRARLGRYLLYLSPAALAAAVGLGVLAASGSPMLEAFGDRFGSILSPGETLSSASLEWREFEIGSAVGAIRARPLLGVGLGNDYRPVTTTQNEHRSWLYPIYGDNRLTRFVHNSYLYLTVKTGLLGLIAFVWFAAALLVTGARSYLRAPPGPGRPLLLAVTCGFAGLLEWSAFEAHLMLTPSMATLGTMVGLAGAAIALDAARARAEARRVA